MILPGFSLVSFSGTSQIRTEKRGVIYELSPMFTVVATPTRLSLDEHFIKRPAATFFVTVEGDGMDEQEIRAGDTLIVDRSRTPGSRSIVVAVVDGELTVRLFSALDREDACVWGVVSGLVRDLP